MSVTTADIEKLQARIDELQTGSDVRWLMLTGGNCFLMVLGFALLEAGSLRAQNLSMVMLKQAVVACVAGFVWYLWGHGLAFGNSDTDYNNFLGTGKFALKEIEHWNNTPYANWLFQMTFCAVSCSIISGAIGERMLFPVYFCYLFLASGWIYPITAYAEWSENGWNSPFNNKQKTASLGASAYTGAIDAAGCGPVHIVGGIAAFIGAWRVRPRHGRFDPKTGEATHMPGHNSSLVTMGVLLLWFSWFSFNSGALIINNEHHHLVIARSVCNTMIASCTAGLLTLVAYSGKAFLFEGHKAYFPLSKMLGGVLTGLVAITAGSTVVEPWAAFVYGVLSVPTYMLLSHLELDILKIDDPVEAWPVHFGGGVLGLFLTGLFAQIDAIRLAYDNSISKEGAGAFMGGDGKLLGYNLICVVFCTFWSLFFTFGYFYLVELVFGTIRVSSENEERGMPQVFGDGYDYLSPLEKIKQMESHLKVLYAVMNDGVVGTSETASGDSQGILNPIILNRSDSTREERNLAIQDRINQGRGAGSQTAQQNNNHAQKSSADNSRGASVDGSVQNDDNNNNNNENNATSNEDDEELQFVQYGNESPKRNSNSNVVVSSEPTA